MKKKIFKYYLILTMVVLIVSVVFTSEIAQKYYKYEVENKLKSIAFSIEYYLLKSDTKINYDDIAKDYASMNNQINNYPEDKLRITFIDFSGHVLGDSEANYQEMENHLSRKEVQEALKGSTGSDIRHSKTINLDMLYVAIPLKQKQNVIVRVSVPLTQLKKIGEMIWFYAILVILFGLLLTIIVSLRITTSIIRPLKEMIFASQEISNGNYTERISLKSTDELGQLAVNFNEMASKLDETILDLNNKKIEVESIVNSITSGIVAVDNTNKIILLNPAAFNIFKLDSRHSIAGDKLAEHIRNNHLNHLLQETITRNKPLEGEVTLDEKILRINTSPIRPTNSELNNSGGILFIQDITKIRKLEQLRTEFVSNVTHELKTPLTSIRGFIETLKNGAINNEKVANRFLDIIDIEAERLYALINDILQLSEIETKLKETDLVSLSLKSLIDAVFEVLQTIANEKNISLHNQVSEEVILKANKNRMKQLILNLVDNGIKYNTQNGSVTVDAYREQGKVIISVKDTGIGIPSEHISRVFERFYRVDKGRSRNLGGTGLGLSIVKHIVNLYNGDIKVNSEVGKGTEFTIQIPY
ncbi:MAG: ATP-binding protein [Bacillota bacterium]|nr:ATP-binding protein [Bacillota bacterium]